jgi:hypothetical protein
MIEMKGQQIPIHLKPIPLPIRLAGILLEHLVGQSTWLLGQVAHLRHIDADCRFLRDCVVDICIKSMIVKM